MWKRYRSLLGMAALLLVTCRRYAECPAPTGPAQPGPAPTEEAKPGAKGAPFGTIPGVALLGKDGIKTFALQGDKQKVNLTPIEVTGQPFSGALRAEILQASGSEYTVQIQAPTTAPVAKGDLLLATFYVRSGKPQEDGKTETQFVFERAQGPYTKSVTYAVFMGPEWRKVQVRFKAAESYGPGGAQAIFRLGYEPETIEVGGVTLENYGQQHKLLDLPSTERSDLAARPKPVKSVLPPAVEGGERRFEVTPSKVMGPISPYVYGINSQQFGKTRATVRRMGGNRQTAYNWELNASNAGSDLGHSNDDLPCSALLHYRDCGRPGAQMLNFVRENQQAGADSLLTVPIVDWVAADKKGAVSEQETAPSQRFLRSYPHKKGALALAPDLNDGAVYQDELVHLIVKQYGRAQQGGVKFYSLDNEPALWPSTHPRVHPQRATYQEVVERSEAAGAAITGLDPSAMVLGAVAFGWSEFMSLSSATDAKEQNAKYQNYLAYYLASMKALEQKHGRRLVHVLDVHWYPEVRGTKRITEDDTSVKTIQARLAAPRSLWDSEYLEKSAITDEWKKPIRLFPWLKELVEKRYPGTKLSMTEYNYGAGSHVSGGLAQADVLGIFGREGVYLATYWGAGAGVGPLPSYVGAAYELYRNYDGQGHGFGDTAVGASVDDKSQASIYAATDSRRPGVLTIIVINKDVQANVRGQIQIGGKTQYLRAEAFGFDASAPEVKSRGSVDLKQNVLSYALPRLSATIFVCQTR